MNQAHFFEPFLKKLTRERVVPIISASVSWLIFGMTSTGVPSFPKWAMSNKVRAKRGKNLPANLKFAPTALGGASSGSELNPCMLVSQQNVGDDRVGRFGEQTAQRLRLLIVSSPRARPSSGSNFQPLKTD